MRFIISLVAICMIFSCNSNNNPDVSSIKVELKVRRFEKDIFSLDTNKLNTQLDSLIAVYPSFGENFMGIILGVDPNWSNDTTANYVKSFLSYYRKLYDTSQMIYSDFSKYENEIKSGLQHVKYYFPNYILPKNIITFIGPLDGYGDILSDDALIVGLHHHLGKSASYYNSELLHQTYPLYITERFEPDYIAVNAIKNISLDLFPEKNDEATLAVQMVEKGKRLFLLSKLLPETKEHLIIGYQEKQLEDCYKHEAAIWDLFIQNNMLQTIDNNIIRNYIGEGPKTQELGDASPGNIGSFAGWQIVKKYMNKNKTVTLQGLMNTNAETILEKAKYKP